MGKLSYAHISFLTFQATLQVICVCLAGYICARCGILNAQAQKYVSVLNVNLFTPALIFSKLASSLSLKKIIEISIIPIFYAVSTAVSVGCSKVASRLLRLNEPESNFVTAMSVFGNSNSLPVSLTVALAYTLPNLDWDIVSDDNPDKIASRGILYLLIFQQLGQVLRWSWGYNTLLKRRSPKELAFDPYSMSSISQDEELHETLGQCNDEEASSSGYCDEGTPGDMTPGSKISMNSESDATFTTEARVIDGSSLTEENDDTFYVHHQVTFKDQVLAKFRGFLNFMNPPLYAMALAVVVASIPMIHDAFYVNNGFIQNTLSSAIHDLGSVSIPLILVILGSNLAPDSSIDPPSKNFKKIIVGSLVSRMILPPIILLPIIALCVKYIQISILDDPIFLIVSFILTISPPAIQLSQICQLNGLYEREMASVLFWGYVVLTLPTAIVIVVASLEVLDWAGKLVV
ncbi:hypothetical protein DASC09_000450 [Saccharomycopsis crataegensis]|uniref:Auxin efflux carrier n=1 Tax=Saccharomycopsis crataegensis TaxID=43959 RepID=A0AAV5QE57_9ASCO|nr:hypothetical protein DASC09_000450 [Saccharomycopsis crataegensis]